MSFLLFMVRTREQHAPSVLYQATVVVTTRSHTPPVLGSGARALSL